MNTPAESKKFGVVIVFRDGDKTLIRFTTSEKAIAYSKRLGADMANKDKQNDVLEVTARETVMNVEGIENVEATPLIVRIRNIERIMCVDFDH